MAINKHTRSHRSTGAAVHVKSTEDLALPFSSQCLSEVGCISEQFVKLLTCRNFPYITWWWKSDHRPPMAFPPQRIKSDWRWPKRHTWPATAFPAPPPFCSTHVPFWHTCLCSLNVLTYSWSRVFRLAVPSANTWIIQLSRAAVTKTLNPESLTKWKIECFQQ